MLKKCLDKRNRMPRSCAAAVSLPKCQYFDQMVFLHEKSVNKVTEANLSQPSTFSAEVLTEENQCSPLSSTCSSNSSNFDTSKKSTRNKKKGAQIRCNRMHSLNHSKIVMSWLKVIWMTRTANIICFVEVSFHCLRSFCKGKKDGSKLR